MQQPIAVGETGPCNPLQAACALTALAKGCEGLLVFSCLVPLDGPYNECEIVGVWQDADRGAGLEVTSHAGLAGGNAGRPAGHPAAVHLDTCVAIRAFGAAGIKSLARLCARVAERPLLAPSNGWQGAQTRQQGMV